MSGAIETVGVVGAGFMGTGIAEAVARAGLDARLHEPNPAPLERSQARLGESVAAAVAGGKLEEADAEALKGRVTWTTNRDDLADCDLAIEAVTEDPEVKNAVFHSLDAVLGPGAIIASNTSSIPIAELASQTRRRDRVLGLHFFSPAPVMKLVEVVVGIDTSDQTVERAEAFVEGIGKRPIRTKDRSGFIVNMLLVPYLMAVCGCTRRDSPRARRSMRACASAAATRWGHSSSPTSSASTSSTPSATPSTRSSSAPSTHRHRS